MAQQENATKEARTKEEIVPQYLHEFLDRFDKKEAERFPESRPYDHAIDTKPDFIPKDCKVYPLSPKEQEALDEFLEENLRKGFIRPSKSPQASPFFFVGKKDGKLRPVQDYRRLNEVTIKDAYPLPLIEDTMACIKKCKFFTKLDI